VSLSLVADDPKLQPLKLAAGGSRVENCIKSAKNQTISLKSFFKYSALKIKIGWLFDHLIQVVEVVGIQDRVLEKV
jgi:hypothetical protein